MKREGANDAWLTLSLATLQPLHRSGELLSRLSSDTAVIQEALTSNVSQSLRFAAQLIVGLALIFVLSWELTLVMLSVVPIIAVGAVTYGRYVRKLSKTYQNALGKAGETAGEAFACIRTVRSFSREDHEVARYEL